MMNRSASISSGDGETLSSGSLPGKANPRPGADVRRSTGASRIPGILALELLNVLEEGGSLEQFWEDRKAQFEEDKLPDGMRESVEQEAKRFLEIRRGDGIQA